MKPNSNVVIEKPQNIVEAIKVSGITLLSKDAIKADQDGIRKTLLDLDKSIHGNAVQCVIHASVHGDTSLMRRLLIEIIDDKTGYRRAGLINWMRKFTPMELKGDIINLSGMYTQEGINSLRKQFPDSNLSHLKDGERRHFLVTEAAATPFWSDKDNAETVAKPVFRNTLMSGLYRSISQFRSAYNNTANGKPIDPKKPFFDGTNPDEIREFFAMVEEHANKLKPDNTDAIRKAEADLARARAANETASGPVVHVNPKTVVETPAV